MNLDSIAAECGTLEQEQEKDDDRRVHTDDDVSESADTGIMDVESGL